MNLPRDQLVERLIRAGELLVSAEDQAETDSYFERAGSVPTARTASRWTTLALTNYFKSIRAAFDDRSIRRGIIIVEGDYIACQTWIEGRFVRKFTHSQVGPLAPNGNRAV